MRQDHGSPQRGPRGAVVASCVIAALLAGCLGGGPDAPVATDAVRIPGPWVFEPEVIEVANGTTVTWTNDGGQPHTVTFEALGSDQTVAPGAQVNLTFTEVGTFDYECRFHLPDMKGRVIVTEAVASMT